MTSARGNGGHLHPSDGIEQDGSRRAVLAKIGRFAYVAPALAILAEPKSAEAYGKGSGRGYGNRNRKHGGSRGRKRRK